MPTSMLMHYVNITKLLMENGSQTIGQISTLLRNNNPASLKQDLDFLLENKIIAKESMGENLGYRIGEVGIGLLTFFEIKIPIQPKN